MKSRLTVFVVAALLLTVGGLATAKYVHHSRNAQITALAAQAEGGVFIAGTLATLGSFEWDAAPLTNHAAMVLHDTALAVKHGQMNADQGQAVLDHLDHAQGLITQALSACAQNGQTGKCGGSEATARSLLDRAREELSAYP